MVFGCIVKFMLQITYYFKTCQLASGAKPLVTTMTKREICLSILEESFKKDNSRRSSIGANKSTTHKHGKITAILITAFDTLYRMQILYGL